MTKIHVLSDSELTAFWPVYIFAPMGARLMLGRKAKKLGADAANEFAARLVVQELMVATLLGTSLAAMSPESAAKVRADLARRLAIMAQPAARAFATALTVASVSMLSMVEVSEMDTRDCTCSTVPTA